MGTIKVMWGIFDDLFKAPTLDDSGALDRSLAIYKQRVARRSRSGSFDTDDGGPIML